MKCKSSLEEHYGEMVYDKQLQKIIVIKTNPNSIDNCNNILMLFGIESKLFNDDEEYIKLLYKLKCLYNMYLVVQNNGEYKLDIAYYYLIQSLVGILNENKFLLYIQELDKNELIEMIREKGSEIEF